LATLGALSAILQIDLFTVQRWQSRGNDLVPRPELLLGSRLYTPAVKLWAVGCAFTKPLLLRPIFNGEEAKNGRQKAGAISKKKSDAADCRDPQHVDDGEVA